MLRGLLRPLCWGFSLLSGSACSAIPGTAENQARSVANESADRAHLTVENLPGRPPLENIIHAVATYGDVMSAEGDEWHGGAVDTVESTLAPMVGPGVQAAEVKAALEVALPGVAIDVATQGEMIGVAGLVAGPMLRDCVYARLSPAGVESWVPPHVYEQAGETSCIGAEAFSDFTRHAPH
jgi:hypothetical protein